MHPLIPLQNIISFKYYTKVPISSFKRFTLPANDNLMRATDFYKLLHTSISELGVLDPVLCYDIANVDLNNPPVYRGRQIHGAYLLRGNVRWLVCKDLNIIDMNAIVVKVDYGATKGDLFKGTEFKYSTVTEIDTKIEATVDTYFSNYTPACRIKDCCLTMRVPSLVDVAAFGVSDWMTIVENFNAVLPVTDYTALQLVNERG